MTQLVTHYKMVLPICTANIPHTCLNFVANEVHQALLGVKGCHYAYLPLELEGTCFVTTFTGHSHQTWSHTHIHTHTHAHTHTHTHTHNNPPLTILVCSPNTSSKAWRQQSVMSCPAKTHLLCQAVLVSELSEVSDVLSGLQ